MALPPLWLKQLSVVEGMDTSSDSWLELLTLEAPGESRKSQALGWASPLGHAPVFPPGFHLRGRRGKNTHKSHPHPSSLLQTWENGPREGREKNKTPSARTAGDSFQQLTGLKALEERGKKQLRAASTATTCPAGISHHVSNIC